MPEPPTTYWMIVTSPDNYERTRTLRFTQQGVKSRHRRKAERMAPGDRVCWYLTGIQSFAATATITAKTTSGPTTFSPYSSRPRRSRLRPLSTGAHRVL